MVEKLVHFVEWKKIPEQNVEETLGSLAEWGVKYIVAHPVWGVRDAAQPGYFASMIKKIAKAGLETPACHAYWGGENDLYPGEGENVLRTCVLKHSVFLEKLAGAGVKTYTIHMGGPDGTDDLSLWDVRRKVVEGILPTAEKAGIAIAVENGHDTMELLKYMFDYVDSMNHPNLGICFDTGHANCYTGDVMKTLTLLKKRMVTCHMHDNFGSFDDHNPPGGGNIQWAPMIASLKTCPNMLHAETESGDWSRPSWDKFVGVWNA